MAMSILLAAVVLLALLAPAQAQSRLGEFLRSVEPGTVFPGADRFGPVEGVPPTAPAFAGDRLLGYVYLNSDVVNSTGYSGKPINILVGLALDGTIAGARLVEHHEPIVLVGIPEEKILNFIDGYVGRKVLDEAASAKTLDLVSGATVTVMVIGDTIMRSAIRVARAKGLGGSAAGVAAAAPKPVRTLDESKTEPESWETLLGDGSVRRLHLTIGEVNAAFERAGNPEAAARPERGAPDDDFIDLYVGLASVPAIGRSLLGDDGYERLKQQLKPGQQAIILAANGAYSFKGSGYVRGGIFDRFEVIQGDNSIRFRDRNHRRLGDLAADGAPSFREIGLFVAPEDSGFDPTEPWRLQLLVQRAIGARDKAFITFDLGYALPDKYVRTEQPAAVVASTPAPPAAASPAPPAAAPGASAAEPEEEPLWQRIWRSKTASIAVLVVALGILTAIFFFQDWLVRRPVLYERVRLAFLAFTLVWIGWVAQAQLSVVNILTFASALRTDFRWEYFLMAPLIFVLWFAVAAALLFWGRGAFCGWLCPFGALQELLNRGARLVGIPQLRVPWSVHQRLVAVKYIIFLVLFGISLSALALAEKAAEVEPFKTAITLHFVRSWPFVLYAAVLLAASLFVDRFFCRYLCPLGAGLAIPARLRMFDWLRRYRECGNPCQRCANECPVQAIHPEGHINPNECIQCLHCQMLYHHDQKCPVMIQKRLKLEKRLAMTSPSMRTAPPVRAGARATEKAET
ncbi:MAG: regulatory protein NosR [Rhodospirillales bacterium]|nr:regulatory protein NosR [Rhodospirillales bacterium]